MKFDFLKSIETDFQNKLQSLETKLDLQTKNILYITYRIDSVLKKLNELVNDKGLQKQVDEYFNDTSEPVPEDSKQDLD